MRSVGKIKMIGTHGGLGTRGAQGRRNPINRRSTELTCCRELIAALHLDSTSVETHWEYDHNLLLVVHTRVNFFLFTFFVLDRRVDDPERVKKLHIRFFL